MKKVDEVKRLEEMGAIIPEQLYEQALEEQLLVEEDFISAKETNYNADPVVKKLIEALLEARKQNHYRDRMIKILKTKTWSPHEQQFSFGSYGIKKNDEELEYLEAKIK